MYRKANHQIEDKNDPFIVTKLQKHNTGYVLQ